jgi:hypothetical protein
MRTTTTLIRIRFPFALIERLDRLAERLRLKERRRFPRAALVRALVQMHLRAADEERREINDALGADTIKRGREKTRPPARRRRVNAEK